MKANYKYLLVIFSTLFLTACPFDGGGNTAVISKQIPVSGGQTTSNDQRLTLTFPANALSTSTNITVKTLSPSEIAAEYPDAEGIDFAYELGPDGTTFSEPIEVSFLLPDSADLSIPRTFMTISNGIAQSLENVSYNPATGIVTGTLSHFSTLTAQQLPFRMAATEIPSRGYYQGSNDSVRYYEIDRQTGSFQGQIDTIESFAPTTVSGTENVIANLFHESFFHFNSEAQPNQAVAQIDYVCVNPAGGADAIHIQVTYSGYGYIFRYNDQVTPTGRITGSLDVYLDVSCAAQPGVETPPETEPDTSTSVGVSVGQAPEAVKKAGSPPYAFEPDNLLQRFITSGIDQLTIFNTAGALIKTIQLFVETFGALYLEHSSAGDFYLAYGPDGKSLCPISGGFCQIDPPVFGNPSGNNTTSVEYGVDANGNQVFNQAFRVRNGTLGHITESGSGFQEVDVYIGSMPNTTVPLFAYEPLTPLTGIGITSDGHGYFINHDTDIVTEFTDSLGTGMRDLECDQFSAGNYGCAFQSFSDATITACAGTNASDFTCGSAVPAGDGVSLGVAVNDAGNLAVIGADYSDSSIHALEFTPTLGLELQLEFFYTDWITLYSEVGLTLSFLGHAELDASTDSVILTGNGSNNAAVIPLDALGGLNIVGAEDMTVWFQ